MRTSLFVIGTLAVLVLSVFQCIWKPWLSPDFAAEYLATYEPAIPFDGTYNASLMWGKEIYEPLRLQTNNFDDLNSIYSADTLLEILKRDPSAGHELANVLLASKGKWSKLLGCYLVLDRELDKSQARDCREYFTTIHSDPNAGLKKLLLKDIEILLNEKPVSKRGLRHKKSNDIQNTAGAPTGASTIFRTDVLVIY